MIIINTKQGNIFVNDGDDWTYRREWMQNHQKPDDIEADEVARLNTTIEAQAAEIRELKAEIKRLEANEKIRQLLHPTEEKLSWWSRLLAWFD